MSIFNWSSSKRTRPARPTASGARRHGQAEAAGGDWTRLRSAPRPQDLAPTNQCLAWIESLGPDVRPAHLPAHYPWVANRLALCWSDPVLTGMVFNDLMMDRRGRRMGFPQRVAAELVRLRVFHDKQPFRRAADSPWALHSLALTDR